MPEKSQFRKGFSKFHRISVSILLILLVGVMILYFNKTRQISNLSESKKAQEVEGIKVNVAEAVISPPTKNVRFLGETRPFFSSNIFGRVSGFLLEMKVDKGDEVQKGDVLATIESPEIDKSYLAALSDANNKKRIAARYLTLLRRKLVSNQEAEQAFANSDIANATLETQRILRSYKEVRAPFSGIITARYADPGALIQNATNSQGSSQVLLTLAQTNVLRVYIYVDQANAPFTKPGVDAEISFPNHSEIHITEKVARIADQLDPNTRTLFTEIDIQNEKHQFIAGSFVDVTLKIPTLPSVQVPVKTLVVRNNQNFVPIITPDNRIHFRQVQLGENDGIHLKITQGLQPGEKVAMNLGNSVAEGQKVQVQSMAGQKPQSHPSGS